MMARADTSETSCSTERPPKTTPTLSLRPPPRVAAFFNVFFIVIFSRPLPRPARGARLVRAGGHRGAQRPLDRPPQHLAIRRRQGRDRQRAGMVAEQPLQDRSRHLVPLVEDQQRRTIRQAEPLE